MNDTSGTRDLFTALETCRAIRYLQPNPVPRSVLEQLVYYATRASNPGNSQLWSFVILQDAAKKQRIADAVRKVMLTGLKSRTADTPTAKRMFEGARNLLETLDKVPALIFVCAKNGYPPANPVMGFVWSAVYPASQNLILAARGLGLGTTFTTFHMVAKAVVREVLALPDDVLIGTTLCIGYPGKPFGPVKRKPVADVIHHVRCQAPPGAGHRRNWNWCQAPTLMVPGTHADGARHRAKRSRRRGGFGSHHVSRSAGWRGALDVYPRVRMRCRPPHAPNSLYHVTLRGNRQQPLFHDTHDRHAWQRLLTKAMARYGARLHLYCWMTNHIHMVLECGVTPIFKTIHLAAGRYARAFNAKYDHVGHLFQGRYGSRLIDTNDYLLNLVAYIHLNPVTAGMASAPADYRWSSCRWYCANEVPPWLTTSFVLALFGDEPQIARARMTAFIESTIETAP